nr:hypothetical protein CFP56_67115 [Quercus suber]
MYTSQQRLQLLPLVIFLVSLFFHFHASYGDVGTAALKSPPYLPTACYGSDESQFPSSNFFAAASDAIWANDNSAFGTIANSSTNSSYINIEFEQVHGEDVVPLGRGQVPPSAPNPTTEDASGHP